MLAIDIHQDTRRIADALAAVPPGTLISLDAISAVIERDIRRARWYLYSAMHIAERESGAVFATERGMGYRRLIADEIVKIGQTSRARIRRQARRGNRSISAGVAGVNDLKPETLRRILAEQSSLGLLEHIARDKNLPTVSEQDIRPLPVASAAKEFLRIIGARMREERNDGGPTAPPM